MSNDVIGDLIEPPQEKFPDGSIHENSLSSSQSSLTKHLDITNNYNSESFQEFNNNEQSVKLKASLKQSENTSVCLNDLNTGGVCSNKKNIFNHNISIDLISSEEDLNNQFEINQNLEDINCIDDNSNKQIFEKTNRRNSENNAKINNSIYEFDDKEIVYDQINEIITKITTGLIFKNFKIV